MYGLGQLTSLNLVRMRKRSIAAIVAAITILYAAISAHANTIASSTFETDAEGWVVVNWDGSGSSTGVTYHLNGGNPSGFISIGDVYGDTFWKAPSKFLGDRSSAYGGTLSYDIMTTTNPDWVMYDIYIVGNGNTISYAFNNNPTANWKHYSVELNEGKGWKSGPVYQSGGTDATAAQIQDVLANVTDIRIRAEFTWGSDNTYLDNVVLTGTGPNTVKVNFDSPTVPPGGGTVVFTPPPEIGTANCNSTCSRDYPIGTTVILTAYVDGNSLFDLWTGDCSGKDCSVKMDANREVTTAFSYVKPAKVGNMFYDTLNAAYGDTNAGAILAREYTFTENLDVGKNISISGGYDTSFNTRHGFTTINGKLTISTGSMKADSLAIR
jgi:hypothetical protein